MDLFHSSLLGFESLPSDPTSFILLRHNLCKWSMFHVVRATRPSNLPQVLWKWTISQYKAIGVFTPLRWLVCNILLWSWLTFRAVDHCNRQQIVSVHVHVTPLQDVAMSKSSEQLWRGSTDQHLLHYPVRRQINKWWKIMCQQKFRQWSPRRRSMQVHLRGVQCRMFLQTAGSLDLLNPDKV